VETTVNRKQGPIVKKVPCPAFIDIYNKYMNGVDSHDQLRLQRYSVQRSIRMKKYYKSLFLGLLDMALVNSYILHRLYSKTVEEKPMTHAEFRILLQDQLLKLGPDDLAQRTMQSRVPSPGGAPRTPLAAQVVVSEHTMCVSEDKNAADRFRFRVCKVCSALQIDKTKSVGTTRAYCKECSSEKGRIYLCDKIRGTVDGNQLTCFQVWHGLWQNGSDMAAQTKRIRMRKGAQGRVGPDPAGD
jgi:hypothetical protein